MKKLQLEVKRQADLLTLFFEFKSYF